MNGCGRKVGPFDCCTIIHGDSRTLLKEIPDGFVHLVLTDPPYGIGLEYDGYKDSPENLRELVATVFTDCLRISPLVMLTPGIRNLSLYPQPTWILCWYYNNGQFRSPWGFSCWQPILCYGPEPYLSNGLGSRPDVIDMPCSSIQSVHPCPKPTRIWKHLMLRAFPTMTSNSIRRVVDPFAGSGTTARVAMQCGVHFLCFEQSRKYWEEAVYLLDNSPMSLFDD
jgi:DNA modification methylase